MSVFDTDQAVSGATTEQDARLFVERFGSGAATPTSSQSHTGSHWLRWAEDQIKESFYLLDDWDGQGSPPVDPRAAKNAGEVVRLLFNRDAPRPTSIGATTDGGISIEWAEDFWNLVIEIEPDGDIDGWYRTPDGEYQEI